MTEFVVGDRVMYGNKKATFICGDGRVAKIRMAQMNTEGTEREPLKRDTRRVDPLELRKLEQSTDRLQYALFRMARGY
jgi:hypothetical protein